MLRGIIRYRYYVGGNWDYRCNCWGGGTWYPSYGWFQADIEDFKKFYNQIREHGIVGKIYLADNDVKEVWVAERPPYPKGHRYYGAPGGDISKPFQKWYRATL